MANTMTMTDNRTGKSWEFPILSGTKGPDVVVVDAGEYAGVRDAVFRLRHIVEAGVVHDAGGMAVGFYPGFRAEAVDGHGAGRAEVVTQAESVTHFMG